MNINEDDNLYIYKEEDDLDDSPLNYASSQYNLEQEEEDTIPKDIKKRSAFRLLLKIMFSPVQGWKDLRRENPSVESLQSGCLYPILAILAISKFADYFYSVNVSLTTVVTKAVVSFVSFFFGYYCILLVLSKLLQKNTVKNFENDYGKEYIIVALSTLAMFAILTDLLPMLWPILIFLPLWTLYLLYQGSRFFQLATAQELRFMLTVCGAIIGVPLLIDWGLNELLPY